MRHQCKGKKIGTSAEHRKSIMRNLASQILIHEKVKTTEVRAKEVRALVDAVITLAKKGDLQARRRAISLLGNKEAVSKAFGEYGERFKERNGGYTRIVKLGFRLGDGAPVVIISLV